MHIKYKKLLLSLALDAIGMMSFTVPGLGEFPDVIWAPVAAWLIYKMYGGMDGKLASVLTFVEEILPGTDIIPTFTAMWVYRYVIQRRYVDEAN